MLKPLLLCFKKLQFHCHGIAKIDCFTLYQVLLFCSNEVDHLHSVTSLRGANLLCCVVGGDGSMISKTCVLRRLAFAKRE